MLKFDFSRFDFCFTLSSLVKRNANYTIEQRNCKGHEKRDRLRVSKVEFIFQISQRNKNFTYRSSFFILRNFYEKSENEILFLKFKEL